MVPKLVLYLNDQGNKFDLKFMSEIEARDANAHDNIPPVLNHVADINTFDDALNLLNELKEHPLPNVDLMHDHNPKFGDHSLSIGFGMQKGSAHEDSIDELIEFVTQQKRYATHTESQPFYDALEVLHQKAKSMKFWAERDNTYIDVSAKAWELCEQLKTAANQYFDHEKTLENYNTFKATAVKALKETMPILKVHRGWNVITPTDSSTKAHKLEYAVKHMKPPVAIDNDWNNQWIMAADNHCYSKNEKQAWQALELLAQYAGFFRHDPIFGLPVAWGGGMGRFFSGHWGRRYGDEVENAIENYYHMDGELANTSDYHTLEYVLARVKKHLGNTTIHPKDDLAKIIKVIEANTGVDYAKLSTEHINQYKVNLAKEYAGLNERLKNAVDNIQISPTKP